MQADMFLRYSVEKHGSPSEQLCAQDLGRAATNVEPTLMVEDVSVMFKDLPFPCSPVTF